MTAVHTAQHQAHSGLLQLATAKSNCLIGQRQGVTHGATCSTRQQAQRLVVCGHVFLGQHSRQVLQHRFGRHGAQVELQAAAEHRYRYFLRIGRGQHKLEIFRRLFQRLQHGVECGVCEHVHFVDHEDLEAPLHGLVDRLLQQALHLIDAAIGSCIKLGVVRKTATIDFGTGRADTARCGRDAALAINALAVEGLGENARYRGFTHAASAGEQIRVMQTLLSQRIAQRLHDMFLPHHFGECAGTVFTGKH